VDCYETNLYVAVASSDEPAMSDQQPPQGRAHGEILSEISEGVVALLKTYYGRGPTHSKTYYQDDLVVCLLRGGFSPIEQTLIDAGRVNAVVRQRIEFQAVMSGRFSAVVEQATGRQVIGFTSGNQNDPPLLSEVFVLAAPTAHDDRIAAPSR
jgi:uncharacterized protein YbcI